MQTPFALAKKKPLFLLFICYITLRSLMLFTAVEATSWVEELERGTIAKELLSKPKVSIWEYQSDAYHGGSLVIGFVASFWFRILGPNLLALKLAPWLFDFATFFLLFFFLNRFYSKRTTVIGTLLFVTNPLFARFSFLAMGFHYESLFYSTLILIFFFEFLHKERHQILHLFLAGIFSGFGFWHANITALTFLSCLITLGFQKKALKSPYFFLSFFLGGLLGSFPYLVHNFHNGGEGLLFLNDILVIGNPGTSLWGRLLNFPVRAARSLAIAVPASFHYDLFGSICSKGVTYGFYLAGISSVFWVIFSKKKLTDPKRMILLPLLLCPLFFVVLYTLSRTYYPLDFSSHFFSFRYFVLPVYFLTLLFSIAIAQTRFFVAFAVFFSVAGCLSQAQTFFRDPFAIAIKYKGFDYGSLDFALKLNPFNSKKDFKRFESFYKLYELPGRLSLCHTVSLEATSASEAHLDQTMPLIMEMEKPCRYYLLEGAGYIKGESKTEAHGGKKFKLEGTKERAHFNFGFAQSFGLKIRGIDKPLLVRLRKDPELLQYILFHAAASFFPLRNMDPATWIPDKYSLDLTPNELVALYRGLGNILAYESKRWMNPVEKLETSMAFLPASLQNEVYWGMGWGYRDYYFYDRVRAENLMARYPMNARENMLQGSLALEAWYKIPT